MSHKKAGGSTSNLRDSNAQRLGLKKYDGEKVKAGNIIIRQRGTHYNVGKNVMKGKDDTIFATADGFVKFTSKKMTTFAGKLAKRNFVHVLAEKK